MKMNQKMINTANRLLQMPRILFLTAFGLAASGCSGDPDTPTPGPGPETTDPTAPYVVIALNDYDGGDGSAPSSEETAAMQWQAGLFEAGKLTAVYDATHSPETGEVGFRLDHPTDGTLYVVSRGEGLPDLQSLSDAGISEQEWLTSTAELSRGVPARFYSGHVSSVAEGRSTVRLTRGVARLDLQLRVTGSVSIERFTVAGAALETPLFAGTEYAVSEYGDITFTLDTPCTEDRTGVAYLYAQRGPDALLRAEAVIDGKRFELEAPLPAEILRNRIYVVTVEKQAVEQLPQLTVESWEAGDDVEMRPDFGGRITVVAAHSSLPAGVVVSDDLTQLTLPYGATELTLALECNDELELQPVTGYPLTVEPLASEAKGLDGYNRYRIRKSLYAPGMPADEVVLQFRRKGLDELYDEDRIRLHLTANPTSLEGEMTFDPQDYTYDFGRYIDNELGRFILGPGKTLAVEFDAGEDPWVKIVAADEADRTFRVIGGWRPNDPTANGRVQSARLVITDAADPTQREEYVISRRNYGLPVTWLHGVWWCKYNARGNSRNFDDQVLSASDPAAAAGKSLFDYLRDCTTEEFYDLWGWAYQGDSGQGMRVVDQGGRLVMEGFTTNSTVHINKLPADALSPDGYELPTMEEFNRVFDATDYVWVMWSGTHTLRTPWEGHTQVKREQRRRNDLTVGSVQASDLLYTKMWSPDFTEYEPLTWYGPGAQWNADGIMHSNHYNNILFGVHSPEGAGWYFAGSMAGLYLQKNGAGTKDTRILRFKKSPVEYIYGE